MRLSLRRFAGTANGDAATLDGLDSTAFLLADGSRTGGTSAAQPLTNGVQTGKVIALSDSTNAIGLFKANGVSQDVYYDSTNGMLGIGGAPAHTLYAARSATDTTGTVATVQAIATPAPSGASSANYYAFFPAMTYSSANATTGTVSSDIVQTTLSTDATGFVAVNGVSLNVGVSAGRTASGTSIAGINESSVTVREAAFTNAYGALIRPFSVGGGSITNDYGIRIATPTIGAGSLTALYGLYIDNMTVGSTNYAIYTSTGLVRFGDRVIFPASTTSAASATFKAGVAPTSPADGDVWKNTDEFVMHASGSNTNTILNALRLRRGSSGTPAAGFGSGLSFQLKSSTTAGQDAARITTSWLDATHATRGGRLRLTTFYTTTENVGVTIGSNSSGALLSFYDVATPIARQVLATGAGATVDNVITALQALGLVKQS